MRVAASHRRPVHLDSGRPDDGRSIGRSGSTSDNRDRRRVLNSANATRADLPLLLLSVLLRRRCWLQALSDKAVNTAASIALDSIGATSPPCHPRPSRAVQRLPLPTVSHHGLVPLSQLCRRLSSDPFVPASSSCHFPKWLPEPPRIWWRLQLLREWSHEQVEQIFC
jgi:hypothetical protein